MKTTVTVTTFVDAFRALRPDNFSNDGLQALFSYLEEYETDTGEELELDVIALCCDFAEYQNLEEFQRDYSDEYQTIDEIEEDTTVIMINHESFIIQIF